MKKFFLITLAAPLLFIMSCNNSNKQPTDRVITNGDSSASGSGPSGVSPDAMTAADKILKAACTMPGTDDFIIDSAKAKEMMDSFETIFRKVDGKLSRSTWIDSCLIVSLADFLDSTDYDGIWVYNGAKKDKESSVLLIPTKQGTKHPADLGASFADCSPTEYEHHRLGTTEKKKMLHRFNKVHRKATKEDDYSTAKIKSLSRGMWVNECVIILLANLLKIDTLKLDGVRIHSASYFKNDGPPFKPNGRFEAKQSSFVLVVTNSGGHKVHIDNWAIIDKFIKKYGILPGGYNHGDLCPTTCEETP